MVDSSLKGLGNVIGAGLKGLAIFYQEPQILPDIAKDIHILLLVINSMRPSLAHSEAQLFHSHMLVQVFEYGPFPYEMEYHHDVQGLIYNTLRGSNYDIHDKQGYKFFSFSNIFPFHYLRKDDVRNLIISSPSNDFVSYLQEQFEYLRDIRIGRMKFRIDHCDKLNLQLPSHDTFSLITGTPIITRVRKEKYENVDAQQFTNGRRYVYWRSDHPIDLFITQLEDNLIKKYNEYYGLDDTMTEQRDPIFYKCRFLKQVSTRLFIGLGELGHIYNLALAIKPGF